jgi:hypothetical protein
MPTVQCKQCGAEFHRSPSNIKPSGLTFCNRACVNAYKKSLRPVVICEQCGIEFHRSPSNVNRYKHNFCCLACYETYSRGLYLTATCRQCGTAISGSKKSNFCSLACHSAYMRVGRINHQGYLTFRINGKLVYEHRLVMEKHLGRPLLRSEQVHHIDGNRLNNSLSNLIVLSRSEHNREHFPLTWDLDRAKAMRAEGFSFSRIGRELGVTHNAVHSAFINRGLHTPRTRV